MQNIPNFTPSIMSQAKTKRSFKADLLAGAPSIAPFCGAFFHQFDPALTAATRKSKPVNRALLVETLRNQNAGLPNHEKVMQQIALLTDENTFTVTTGHQLCLGTGPLYSIYKAITAVALAAECKRRCPELNFVPVFWMASEDHDAEEVNHYFLSFTEKRSYTAPFAGAVGRHLLTDEVQQWGTAFSKHYQPGRKWSEAFRLLLHELLGSEGLVLLDGDDAALKATFAPAMARELEQSLIHQQVTQTIGAMEAAGYEAQATPREVNLFYLDDEQRQLIVPAADGFSLKDGSRKRSQAEWNALLQAHPECFSPNVLMRPLYECTLLPDIAYVGGWAELTYWSQLRSSFEAFDIPFPVLFPRMSASLLPQSVADRWSALALKPEQLNLPLAELQDLIAAPFWNESELQQIRGEFESSFERLRGFMTVIDPTMDRNVAGESSKLNQYLEGLPKKIRKAIANRHPEPFRRMAEIKNQLAAEGQVQERVLNFFSFAGENHQDLIQLLLSHCKPFAYSESWILIP